jgi:hypothetical protein
VARLGLPGGLSAAGKKELWERWRVGESISDIARALRKAPGSIHGMIEATGGIYLSAQAAQARMRAHSGRAGGDLPRARYGRISACDRRPAGPVGFHRL